MENFQNEKAATVRKRLGTTGLQVPIAVAKFLDLVIGYSLLPLGNCVSSSARIFFQIMPL